MAMAGLHYGGSRVLGEKAGTANRPQAELKAEMLRMEAAMALVVLRDSIPWGGWAKMAFTSGQLSALCLAGSQPYPPSPPLGEEPEKLMTEFVLLLFCRTTARALHCV